MIFLSSIYFAYILFVYFYTLGAPD